MYDNVNEIENELSARESFLGLDNVQSLSFDFQCEQGQIDRQQNDLRRRIKKYRIVLRNYAKLQRSIYNFNQKHARRP